MGYSSLKKYTIGKNAETIEGWEKKSKGKSVEVEKKL
jgi:hypothetical protein